MRLEEPMEMLELDDGQTIHLQVVKWGKGTTTIVTDEAPGGKEIPVMRVWVVEGTKEWFPPWWDITSKRVMPQLEGIFKFITGPPWHVSITKFGVKPRARFTVHWHPAPGAA